MEIFFIILIVQMVTFLGIFFLFDSGIMDRLVKLIPPSVREMVHQQPRWVVWMILFLGMFLMGFSLTLIIKTLVN